LVYQSFKQSAERLSILYQYLNKPEIAGVKPVASIKLEPVRSLWMTPNNEFALV
jgi:hypothetical protein